MDASPAEQASKLRHPTFRPKLDAGSEASQSRSARSVVRPVPRSQQQRDFSDTTDDDIDEPPSKETRRHRPADKSGSIESLKRNSLLVPDMLCSQAPCELKRNHFFKQLDNWSLQRYDIEQSEERLPGCSRTSVRFSVDADEVNKQSGSDFSNRPVLSRHRFSRVRPLHVCAEHNFVCFRNNGDLVASTPHSVLIYDRPPAACEISYKEPLYSIPISGVSLAADLSHSRILVLRQGSYMASDERAADELLMAEVATGDSKLVVKIALPQNSILRSPCDFFLLQEMLSRRDSAECRGMQVNQTEHKVYLLYDYHLLVIDLDMQLEPLVIKLRCHDEFGIGPAVALMEFDHAIYVLTAGSFLLATSKADLFSPSPGACCLPVLQRLDGRLSAREIRSCVVDRRQATAFFSVPHGCKLISLAFPVPASDKESTTADTVKSPVLQERIYAVANCSNGAASVPSAMAWDATTEQLLVLEWGSEKNGVLVTVDFSPDDGIHRSGEDKEAHLVQQHKRTSGRLPVVKTFGPKTLNPLAQRLGVRSSRMI